MFLIIQKQNSVDGGSVEIKLENSEDTQQLATMARETELIFQVNNYSSSCRWSPPNTLKSSHEPTPTFIGWLQVDFGYGDSSYVKKKNICCDLSG